MMKGIIVEWLVYCLKREHENYYVGITYNFNLRYAQHEGGEGAKWTRRHKPIGVVKIIQNACGGVENSKTLEYIKLYGWENVQS